MRFISPLLILLICSESLALHRRQCSQYLKTSTVLTKNYFQKLAPAIKSRVKPVYKEQRFDVRIISDNKNLIRSVYAASDLLEIAVSDMTDILDTYKNLGFTPKYFISALVESHPGAIKIPVINPECESAQWRDSKPMDLCVSFEYNTHIPDLWGRPKTFYESVIAPKEGRLILRSKKSVLLLMIAFSEKSHSLHDSLMIAHELSHTTEPANSYFNLLWKEARADFLTYVATKFTDIYMPALTFEYLPIKNPEENLMIRSLKNPTVKTISEFNEDFGSHLNSQLISSLLYEISISINEKTAVDFVKWMDRMPHSSIVKQTISEHLHYASDAEVLRNYSDSQAGILTIVNALRRWSQESSLPTESMLQIEALLEERGL